MRKSSCLIALMAFVCIGWTACNRPSKVDQYHAQKHVQDSLSLEEQERTLAYYQSQLETMMPVADSLLTLFKYEKNDKYQNHGFYVVRNEQLKIYQDLRVMVRDDGQELLVYRNGKRVTVGDERFSDKEQEAVDRAQHLQVTFQDIRELEKRIQRTNLEVQKYQKRLQK